MAGSLDGIKVLDTATTVSEKIAEWAETTAFSDMPSEVVRAAKRSILDLSGVAIAASREPVAAILGQYLGDIGARGQASVFGMGIKTSCAEAAFTNGVLGHYFDYDDLLISPRGSGGHPSAVILPAVLAVAEAEHRLGKSLIEAFVLGYQVFWAINSALGPSHRDIGWHPTATCGVFGATIAASKLFGLRRREITWALGIAASESSGLRENFGSFTKPFHAGHAAASGVRAASLARRGFTSSRTSFEGRHGFFHVLGHDSKAEDILDYLKGPFCLPTVWLKPYPCCGGSHSAITAVLDITKRTTVPVNEIESIDVRCDPPKSLIFNMPRTALEGKFSMRFPLAVALTNKRVTLSDFDDSRLVEPRIISLMEKIHIVPDQELKRLTTSYARPVIVTIRLRDGRTIEERCDYAPGGRERPLTDDGLNAKFRACTESVLDERKTEQTINTILNLETLGDVADLMQMLHS